MSALAGVLQGVHAMVAFQRSEPHWLLNDPDAARYSLALGNAIRHLPITVAQKALDYTALAMVAFSIETPRVVRSAQLAQQAQRPAPRGPAQVFQFTGGRQPTGAAASAPGGASGGPGGAGGPGAAESAPPPFPQGPDGFGIGEDYDA